MGNTIEHHRTARRVSDHPHVRGEHKTNHGCSRAATGSSPRAWGTPQRLKVGDMTRRIIPTCVGNTMQNADSRSRKPDHPHVRGEHLYRKGKLALLNGSSPRAWGTRRSRSRSRGRSRIIPTCVGNTLPLQRFFAKLPDHPHVRGEHAADAVAMAVAVGSSPRAWGTLEPVFGGAHTVRIIPTCVGNTVKVLNSASRLSDHPHVRGEHSISPSSTPSIRGSSPRAWGTQADRHIQA